MSWLGWYISIGVYTVICVVLLVSLGMSDPSLLYIPLFAVPCRRKSFDV